jgi:hypothetical protein
VRILGDAGIRTVGVDLVMNQGADRVRYQNFKAACRVGLRPVTFQAAGGNEPPRPTRQVGAQVGRDGERSVSQGLRCGGDDRARPGPASLRVR